MKRLSRRFALQCLVVASVFGMAAVASAAPLCTATTMSAYEGSSCQIGNFLFTFGANAYTYTADQTQALAGNVLVTPTGTGTPGSQTGFIFTVTGVGNGWTADSAGNGFADINLAFQVGMANPLQALITSGTMALGANITAPDGTGNLISAGETIGGTGGGAINLTIYGNSDSASMAFSGGTALSGSANLNNSSFTISKDIFIGALDGGTTTVNSVTETFSYLATPEPGPFVLTATSFGLFLLLWRRKSLRRFLGLTAVVLALSLGAAHAAPLCTSLGGSTQHLSDYISAGQCTVGDILFTFAGSSFTESGNASVKPVSDGSNVAVNVLNNSDGIGFHFNPVYFALANQSESFSISFTAQASSSAITGFYASDTVTTSLSGAFSTASSEVMNGASAVPVSFGTNPVLFPSNTGGSGTPVFTSAVAAGTLLTFTDNFSFSVGSSGNVHFSDAVMQLAEPAGVPEPVTAGLTGSALLAVAAFVRRKRSTKA